MSDSSSESEREIDEHKDGGDSDGGGEEEEEAPITFAELGPEDNRLAEVLCDAAASMGWKAPSKIQGSNSIVITKALEEKRLENGFKIVPSLR